MQWQRCTFILAGWLVTSTLVLPGSPVPGRETEEQLVQRIQNEQNPVNRAKDEMKLAEIKLGQAQEAYAKGDTELGAKLVETFVTHMQASWKDLEGSGRKAAKQPQGFKELDIALRERARALEDLERKVGYFERAPIEKATKEMDRIRSEVLQALFPAAKPHTTNPPPAPQRFAGPGSTLEVW